MAGGEGDNSKGYFIKPTIIADLAPKARIMQEEIFGPVVGFTKAKNFRLKRLKLQTTLSTA